MAGFIAAVFARILGKAIKLDNAEDLFAAALLQDMAIPLLLKELPEHYEGLIERRGQEHLRLSQLEGEAIWLGSRRSGCCLGSQLAFTRRVCDSDRATSELESIALRQSSQARCGLCRTRCAAPGLSR